MVSKQAKYTGIGVILAATWIVTAACAGGGDDEVSKKATWAREHIMAAWSIYNEPGNVRELWYTEFDVPSSMASKEEVILYLMHKAAELDAEASAANYNLGVYYLEKDCATAREYFNRHLSIIPEEEDTTRILTRIEECGCDCARDVL